jgi:hypothetical protein
MNGRQWPRVLTLPLFVFLFGCANGNVAMSPTLMGGFQWVEVYPPSSERGRLELE